MNIPKQIYVTAKMVRDADYDYKNSSWIYGEEYPFAFLHPHEPSKKTDAKRKSTQLYWAYGSHKFVDDVVVEYNRYWDRDKNTESYKEEPAKFQPKILDNTPVSGFEIFEVATRYSTSNKLFRVKDPRGFVTEITAKALLGILLGGSVINGAIQDLCVWQANKNLVVYKGE